MKTSEEILKLREVAKKEEEARLKVMKAKKDELLENAKNEGCRFAEEVDLDAYVDRLVNLSSVTIDISKLTEDYPNYTEYDTVNKVDAIREFRSGVIEGLTKRFNNNGFRFEHCKDFSDCIYTLSI